MATTPAPEKVVQLVERFDRNRDSYLAGGINETQLRQEFINPFFSCLGWDIENKHSDHCRYCAGPRRLNAIANQCIVS